MNQRSSTSASSAPGGLQHRLGAGEREARRDGVAGPALAVPALGELEPLGVRALRRGEQVLAQDPVRQHQAGGDPQADPGGLGEQRVDGAGEVRPEDEGGRGAGPGQAGDEVGGDRGGVRVVGEPGLLGQRALLQPVEQRHAEPADGPDLGEVHVGVDEPGQDQPAPQVHDLVGAVVLVGERLAGDDHAVLDDQGQVGALPQPPSGERAVRGVDEGAAEESHFWPVTAAGRPRARRPPAARRPRRRRSPPAPCSW